MRSRMVPSRFAQVCSVLAALLVTLVPSARSMAAVLVRYNQAGAFAPFVPNPAEVAGLQPCQLAGRTLQLALRDIPPGTTTLELNLDPGEYWVTQASDDDNRTAFRTIGNLNVIVGRNGATGEVVLRRVCEGSSQSFRFFRVVEGGTLELTNITLTNGRAIDGGAIQGVRCTGVLVRNCRFVRNVAARGGAISVSQILGNDNSNLLSVTNCEFLCNSASAVGGAVDVDRSRLDVFGGVFSGNSVVSEIATEGFGGGIHFIKGSSVESNIRLQIRPDANGRRPLFYNNTAADGGGMYIDGGLSLEDENLPGVDPVLTLPIEADFANNRVTRRGGAAFLVSSNLRLDRTRFGLTSAELVLALAQWPRINECDVPLAVGNCGGAPGVCNPSNPAGPAPDAGLGGGNRAGLQGGGVYNNRSTSYFKRCFFESNQALSERLFNCDKLSNGGDFGGSGGGLYIRGGSSAARITATECCFTNNRTGSNGASGGGGGVCCVEGSVPVFDDCVVRGNRAARGGGMAFACLADGVVYNTVINANVGTVAGGGLFLQSFSFPGTAVTDPAQRFMAWNPKIVHCTITDNRATISTGLRGVVGSTAGSGIHIQTNDGVPMVLNSIVWGNQSDLTGAGSGPIFNQFGSSFSFGYVPSLPAPTTPDGRPPFGFPQVIFSDIDTGNNNPFPTPVGLPSGSNFDANPRFVFVAQGNVHLTCPSPCVDRASNQFNLAFISSVARQAGQPLRYFVSTPPIDLNDEVAQVTTALQDDYDDGETTTNTIPAPALAVPPINEVCPAPNCTTPYQFGEPIQPRTCRATQCQSDMGADESRTTFTVTPSNDRVVCLGGQQSFTVSANCPDSSACDTALPPVVGPLFFFGWCRLDPGPGGTCIETVIYDPFLPVSATNPAPGYTVSPTGAGTGSTLTITSAQPRDNTVFKAKVYRGGPGLFVPLATIVTVPIPPFAAPDSPGMFTGIACNPLLGCPPGMAQARLFVINPPTVTVIPPNPDIVCRTGNQCLEWDVTWAVLPTEAVTLCGYSSIPPLACTPAVNFGKRTTPSGTDTPILSSDPRIQNDPPVIANGVATQRWRLCFTNAVDSDCGRYTLTVACSNLAAGKCTPASGSADLCVTPPPTATNGGDRNVCVGGQQTLTFTATYPASSCVFCPTAPCTNSAIITKNGTPLPVSAYTCTPINASRQVTCTVAFASAQLTDCGTYCIEASCSNLAAGKCGIARSCANLCVLPLPTVTADPDKSVCVGSNQTLNFSASFPVGSCSFCTNASCTPNVVIKKDNVALSSSSFVCDPITAQRVVNCRVNITNATLTSCGEYCMEATCSNLTSGGKCGTARACTRLCVLPPIIVTASPNAAVCEGGQQTLNFSANFPVGTCAWCTPASCTPSISITKGGVALPVGGFVCDPITAERTVNCRVVITSATQADCAEYCIEATCGNLQPGKCGTFRACTRLCVLPAPVVGGDSDATVCLGGDQTINFFASFPVGTCTHCTASNCTPSVVLKKNGVALPSNRYTCDPITAQRRINCRIRFNPTVADDQAEYCIEATCGNLTGGKCGTSRYCAKLCIVNPSVTTSDQAVCAGGSQCLEFTANYPLLNPSFCPTASCTPAISITKNGTAISPTSYTCTPINATSQFCRVCFTNVTVADAGEYCLSLTCGNLAAAKCPPARGCARLCVVPAPTCTADSPTCVCLGGDQTLNFSATFPLPSGASANFCPANLAGFVPSAIITKGGAPLPLAAYTCDPINASRRINCRVIVTGATVAAGGEYCIEATYSNLTQLNPAKCPPTRCCTTLTVENPPTVTVTPPSKVCVGQNSNTDICFTAPVCCTPSFSFRKDGVPISLGSHYSFTGTGNCRTFRINNPTLADRGVYEVCLSCPNLAANKCRPVCATFRVDILEPPLITGSPAATCIGGSVMLTFPYCRDELCPVTFTLTRNGIPVCTADIAEVDDPATPGVNEARCVTANCSGPGIVTIEPGPAGGTEPPCGTGRVRGSKKVTITNVAECNEGEYEMCIRYVNLEPAGQCRACARVRLDVDRLVPTLPPLTICPDTRGELCVAVDGCAGIPEVIYCFTWYKNGVIYSLDGVTYDGCIAGGTNATCIPVLPPATEASPDVYRVRVTPRDPATCPCPPAETTTEVRLSPPDECCWCVPCENPKNAWDNGRYDGRDGQLSAVPVLYEFPETKVADDFVLCVGHLHNLCKFAGTMRIRQNPALPYKARLTLYEDCDGMPGVVVKVWDDTYIDNICRFGPVDADGYQEVVLEFDLTEEKLWIEGGKPYWFSLQGVSPVPDPDYEAYWVTANNRIIRGTVPKKMTVGEDQQWLPLDDCCIECTDMSFCVEANKCKILLDNGRPGPAVDAGGTRSEKSTSPARNSRAADQIAIGTCNDYMVCVVAGYIYTNCEDFHAILEVYENDCKLPNYLLTGAPYFTWTAEKIEDLGYTVTIDGVDDLHAYRVWFCPMATPPQYPMGLVLERNRNYWFSISVQDTFAQSQRAYWAWNTDPCDPCQINWDPGVTIAPGRSIPRWTSVGNDFAFIVAAKMLQAEEPPTTPPVTGSGCPPDFNGDGNVTMQDLFDYMAAFFAGCP
ncbi:MAG: hypothetical protein IT438_02830 [Phycisphaerales bacterium]|nr:hypothetical protein [Phycisphaerales bacterium]